MNIFNHLLAQYGITKVKGLPTGGAERQHSVHSCIKEMKKWILCLYMMQQDRLLHMPSLHKLVKTAHEKGAAIAGVSAKDTMKNVEDGIIKETVDRDNLMDDSNTTSISF